MAFSDYFVAKFRADTTQVVKDIKKVSDTEVYKIKIKADGTEQKTLVKQINKTIDAEGKLVTETKKFNKESQLTSTTVKETAKAVNSLGAEFLDTLGKVAKFGAVTTILNLFTQGVTEALQTVKEFDDVLTEFKKVSDLNGSALNDYTEKLGELGESVARTRTEMVASSTEFVRSGYSEEDASRLSRIAELYRNIADEAISSEDSAGFIISQMKAFDNESEDFAMHVIDAINNVSNNMAVSSSDISSALSKTSSAMGALGNSYEETIALVTSGTEVMTGQASKVARGLRTIGNNIANLAQKSDTLEISVNGVTKQIALLDSTTGEMRNTFDILQDIYTNGWNDMSNAEQQALAISLAGY